jgi:hypothetical protein
VGHDEKDVGDLAPTGSLDTGVEVLQLWGHGFLNIRYHCHGSIPPEETVFYAKV